jgi:hypothetical protein
MQALTYFGISLNLLLWTFDRLGPFPVLDKQMPCCCCSHGNISIESLSQSDQKLDADNAMIAGAHEQKYTYERAGDHTAQRKHQA